MSASAAIASRRSVPLAGRAAATIDATGLVVAPGFIDLHTHSEMPLVADGTAQSKVRQGVTLDITGESTSAAPRDGLTMAVGDGPAPDWTTFTGTSRVSRSRASR